MDKDSVGKCSTRRKTTGTPKIKMGRQGKRRCRKIKARRGLEGIIIRKRKLETNFLGDMVLKAGNQEEDISMEQKRTCDQQ
jgi:hypothetical protein